MDIHDRWQPTETLQGPLQSGDLVMYHSRHLYPPIVWLGVVLGHDIDSFSDERMLVLFVFDVTRAENIHRLTTEPRQYYEQSFVYRLAALSGALGADGALPREVSNDIQG